MATTYKTFTDNDKTSTRTLLHEAIPITGSLVSGTYKEGDTPTSIKNYAHGMFQTDYDYAYLSSSANHIFDITWGISSNSALSGASYTQNAKKINIYNQMAQVLMGHDATGSIREFDKDGDLTGGTKLKECYFVNFARLLTKDEIKKGSFSMVVGIGTGSDGTLTQKDYKEDGQVFTDRLTITDHSGTLSTPSYKVNSPAGEYGILFATSSITKNWDHAGSLAMNSTTAGYREPVGLLFYQAGIAVLSGSIFMTAVSGGILRSTGRHGYASVGDPKAVKKESGPYSGRGVTIHNSTGSSIQLIADGLRNRIYNVSFNNTTELNSTIYFCRANHNDFNYSSNPTYITGSKIRVKENTLDSPVSYITTIGLYSPDNELMAVAKLSEPLKKTPETEATIRVRLDY